MAPLIGPRLDDGDLPAADAPTFFLPEQPFKPRSERDVAHAQAMRAAAGLAPDVAVEYFSAVAAQNGTLYRDRAPRSGRMYHFFLGPDARVYKAVLFARSPAAAAAAADVHLPRRKWVYAYRYPPVDFERVRLMAETEPVQELVEADMPYTTLIAARPERELVLLPLIAISALGRAIPLNTVNDAHPACLGSLVSFTPVQMCPTFVNH